MPSFLDGLFGPSPSKTEQDDMTVTVNEDGRLLITRTLATSIDLSTAPGRSLSMGLADVFTSSHPKAADDIARAVADAILKALGNSTETQPWGAF